MIVDLPGVVPWVITHESISMKSRQPSNNQISNHQILVPISGIVIALVGIHPRAMPTICRFLETAFEISD